MFDLPPLIHIGPEGIVSFFGRPATPNEVCLADVCQQTSGERFDGGSARSWRDSLNLATCTLFLRSS